MSAVYAALLSVMLPSSAHADNYEIWLASSRDWAAGRGFYLNLESSCEPGARCALKDLKLVLGVGDGRKWRYLSVPMKWETGREYSVRVELGESEAFLCVEGSGTATGESRFSAHQSSLAFNQIAGWARAPTEFLVLQSYLGIRLNGGPLREFHLPVRGVHPRLLFEPQNPRYVTHHIRPGDRVTLEVRFRLDPYPDLKDLSPLVDRYGQSRYGLWPGKVTADEDLLASHKEESGRLDEWLRSSPFDAYGGYLDAGWSEEPTGFYRLTRRDGFWWLVSPAGNPCFYTGLCTVPQLAGENTLVEGREYLFDWLPPKQGSHAAAWTRGPWGGDAGRDYLALQVSNLVRTFGDDWQKQFDARLRRRLRAWGFSGVGKWGALQGLPCVPVLDRAGVPVLARHPDIFDPAVRDALESALRRQIEPRISDPYVVGWSVGNEFHEIITGDDVRSVFRDHQASPAAAALRGHALRTLYRGNEGALQRAWSPTGPPSRDIEAMRQHYAGEYYSFLYRTVKSMDPNHLYFGFWITPGWWENESDWKLIAANCDAVGYDLYTSEHLARVLRRCLEIAPVPVFCGEFSFAPFYDGRRGFAAYPLVHAPDEAEAGDLYARWLKDAAANPCCVGALWFEYRDQPITGGNGEGMAGALFYAEHYAFGAVDVTDRPKWDLVERMRQANLSAPRWRIEASGARRNGTSTSGR